MAQDVIITPANGEVDFLDSSVSVAKIDIDSNNNLSITNSGGNLSIGDTASDVYIGDGTNNVDIVFEQSGEIRGTGSQTITLGQSGDTIAVAASTFNPQCDIVFTSAADRGVYFNNASGQVAYIRQLSSAEVSIGSDNRIVFVETDGGATKFNFDLNSGNLGIGTTSPTYKLDVETASEIVASFVSTDNKASINISDNDTAIYVSAENSKGSFGFNVGVHANNLNIDSSGNVGIGTASPTTKLHVYGNNTVSSLPNLAAQFSATGTGGLAIGDENGTDPYLGLLVATDNFHIKTGGNNKRFTVLSDGNVGIGTTDPSGKLDVNDGTNISPTSGSAGQFRVRGNGYVGFIAMDGTGMHFGHNSSSRSLVLMTNETARLTIAGGGAATFSSNVTLNSRLTFSYNSHYFEAGTNSVAFKNSSGTSYLSVNNTGATVAGTVTATAGNFSGLITSPNLPNKYNLPSIGSSASWVKLGNLSTSQSGRNLYLKIVSASGYNAAETQNTVVEVYFRTSNNSSSQSGTGVDGGNFYGSAMAQRLIALGSNTNSPSVIRIVQVSTTSYDFYGSFNTFTGTGSFYEVLTNVSDTWTNSATTVSEPTSGTLITRTPSVVPYGAGSTGKVTVWDATYSLGYDTNLTWDFTNDRLGISDATPSYSLDVNGDIRAQSDLYIGTGGGHFYNDSGSRVRIDQDFYTNNANTYLFGDNTYLGSSSGDVIHVRDNQFRVRQVRAYDGNGIQFQDDSGTEYMRLRDGGSVGIGTTAPSARLHVGNSSSATEPLRLQKADNNVADHITFYLGATRMGEIGCHETTWLRINQETAKNIYTPRMIRADGGFNVDNITVITGGGIHAGSGAQLTTLNAGNISSGTLSADRLATSGVTAASYTNANITVDSKGRVTAASNGSAGNVGTVTSVTVGTGLDVTNGTSTPNITLDLSEFTDMTADITTTDEVILLDAGAERRKAFGELKLSQFNNDSGWTSNTGNIGTITVGTGLDGGGSSSSVSINLDLSEFTDMTADITTTDEVILLDSGAERRKAFGELKLSKFNNDAGWTSNSGDITAVNVGGALSGGGTSGSVTVSLGNAGAGAGTYGSTADNNKIDQITLDQYGRVTNITTGGTGSGSMSSWNWGVDSSSTTSISNGETVRIKGGTNVTVSRSGNDVTINASGGGSSPNNSTITLSAGNGLTNGGAFTTNQSFNETISFHVGASTGISVSSSAVSVSTGVCMSISAPSGTANPSSRAFTFAQSGGMSISASGSTVTFSSSSASDYRLKKNVTDFNSESWTKVKSVSCRKFDFDAEKFAQAMEDDYTIQRPASYGGRIGFIAHELEAAGIDGAVEGEKDGVDEDGVPIYQKVSYTTLVPVLWGALNEAIRKIEILESKVQALEDSS